MNFKPNLLKTIVSIVLGLVIGYLIASPETISFGRMFLMNVFVVFFLIISAISYIVWSLIEKKK